MKRYKGLAGSSGVRAYEIREEEIILKFTDGRTYLYDYSKPGRSHIEIMKELAEKGQGLTTYVNQHVRENYKARIK